MPSYESEQSVEDLQWIPMESTVLVEILIMPCWPIKISVKLVATGADHCAHGICAISFDDRVAGSRVEAFR
jgi:hypothetical protein